MRKIHLNLITNWFEFKISTRHISYYVCKLQKSIHVQMLLITKLFLYWIIRIRYGNILYIVSSRRRHIYFSIENGNITYLPNYVKFYRFIVVYNALDLFENYIYLIKAFSFMYLVARAESLRDSLIKQYLWLSQIGYVL